jgi:hypothetical protein
MSRPREFSEAALTELLRALRARSASHPHDPALLASWPAVRADRMAAACAELRRRGHPVQRVSNPAAERTGTAKGWTVGVASEAPVRQPLSSSPTLHLGAEEFAAGPESRTSGT